jgi:hypothetical protein
VAEKKIGDTLYSSSPLLAKHAIVLQAKLIRVLGPALPALVRALGQAGDASARAVAGVEALNAISAGLDPSAFGDLVEELCETAEVMDSGRYRRVNFNQDFTDHLAEIIPVVVFVIEAQFGDFFKGLLGNGARGKTAAA